ncbi:hypothetical protein AK88_00089 [Plasmodium fragile]|uniref:PPM-type phosphatase domain-containing protein n=1 Tax=Plasmodium fragile TaxID=5857 RepID=A0A0D9QUE0_PLAFR|nr:uncharacterized protein AK88_00089 [Plasmodium fragile]KJP90241.1 hypothetical protein AK88_00089 [Plasmodium fragile]
MKVHALGNILNLYEQPAPRKKWPLLLTLITLLAAASGRVSASAFNSSKESIVNEHNNFNHPQHEFNYPDKDPYEESVRKFGGVKLKFEHLDEMNKSFFVNNRKKINMLQFPANKPIQDRCYVYEIDMSNDLLEPTGSYQRITDKVDKDFIDAFEKSAIKYVNEVDSFSSANYYAHMSNMAMERGKGKSTKKGSYREGSSRPSVLGPMPPWDSTVLTPTPVGVSHASLSSMGRSSRGRPTTAPPVGSWSNISMSRTTGVTMGPPVRTSMRGNGSTIAGRSTQAPTANGTPQSFAEIKPTVETVEPTTEPMNVDAGESAKEQMVEPMNAYDGENVTHETAEKVPDEAAPNATDEATQSTADEVVESVEDAASENAETAPMESVEKAASENTENTPMESVEKAASENTENTPMESVEAPVTENAEEAPAESVEAPVTENVENAAMEKAPAESVEAAAPENAEEAPAESVEAAAPENAEEAPAESVEEGDTESTQDAVMDTVEEEVTEKAQDAAVAESADVDATEAIPSTSKADNVEAQTGGGSNTQNTAGQSGQTTEAKAPVDDEVEAIAGPSGMQPSDDLSGQEISNQLLDRYNQYYDQIRAFKDSFLFAGVQDGHGGEVVADIVKRWLGFYVKKQLMEKLRNNDYQLLTPSDIVASLEEAHIQLDRDIFKKAKEFFFKGYVKYTRVGSCSLSVLMDKNYYYVSNVGDSKGLLIKKDSFVRLNNIHNAGELTERMRLIQEHPDEEDVVMCKKSIKTRHKRWSEFVNACDAASLQMPDIGGRCYVKGRLQCTRTFGDFYLKHKIFAFDYLKNKYVVKEPHSFPYISAIPEVLTVKRSNDDEFLVLVSDGLSDHLTDEEIYDIVKQYSHSVKKMSRIMIQTVLIKSAMHARMSAKELLTMIPQYRRRKFFDDMSVVVIKLK